MKEDTNFQLQKQELLKKSFFEKNNVYHIEKLLVVTIIIAINVLAIYIYKRFDLTKSKSFSLSTATKSIIDQLDEPLSIKLFFSKNLPGPSNDIRVYLKDLLTEYQTYSKGKVHFEFVNPGSEEKFRRETSELKIAPVQVEIYEKERLEIREIFMGAAIIYKKKNIVIPVFQDTEGLEFLITNTLKKISEGRPRYIAYFQPMIESDYNYGDQFPIPNNINFLYQLVSDIALFDRTDLFNILPTYVDLLIVNGVKDSLHISQLFVLDQFIMSGKPVMFFQDRYVADIRDTSHLFDNNLLDMLRHHGIYVKPSLVLDAENHQVTLQHTRNNQVIPEHFNYPFFPVIKSFTDTLSIHSKLRSIITYFPSEIHYGRGNVLKKIPLLYTSVRSTERAGFQIDTNYEKWLNVNSNIYTQDSKPIAYIFKGPVNSYFTKNPPRVPVFLPNNLDAKIFIAGTTSLTFNPLLANYPDNAKFILNVIDYLTNHEEFIYMRTKNINHSPIKYLTSNEKKVIKYFNFIAPFSIIFFSGSIFRLFINQHKKKIKKASPKNI